MTDRLTPSGVVRLAPHSTLRVLPWMAATSAAMTEEKADSMSSIPRKIDAGEFRPQLVAQLLGDIDDRRELAGELHVVGDAGVDQDAVVEIARQEERVALGGPGLLDDVDVAERVEAGRHRPQHLVEVAGIDVVIDHHRPFAG